MPSLDRIVIVGASLAGLRAAQALREEGFAGDLTLVGAEPHLPYNRPPLSKSLLTGDDDVTLPGDGFDARWVGGRRAVGLDRVARTVTLDDGADLPYDGLVIATGARPRHLPGGQGTHKGVHVLRTLDDGLALRAALNQGPARVVVIGAGFIGGEVASTARSLGLDVTLVEAGPLPMGGLLGETTGRWLADHHRRNGVELITGTRVAAVADGAVRLADGRSVPAGLVVVATGVTPEVGWLEGSGLKVDDGVLTDATLFAQGASDIVAAGDVARWPHPVFGGALVRVEHWANANDQGARAARNLLRGPGDAEPHAEVPGLGTRVHGTRVQWAGFPSMADEALVAAGDPAEDRFSVAFLRDGVMVGGVAVNHPKEAIRLRKAVAAREASASLA
ncbi:NAD(P)/FAD-dependent oxidoreductase [Actinomadura kijaniata]|uniref:NAD(P)/FAD-dependent oxidoreductase n=1 Tax=Actinomadura kijaniata TaxID=46161 RepID=UPI00082D954B|nr:FAD-dependent oxidoreductase [Actinomadura kijaniata]